MALGGEACLPLTPLMVYIAAISAFILTWFFSLGVVFCYVCFTTSSALFLKQCLTLELEPTSVNPGQSSHLKALKLIPSEFIGSRDYKVAGVAPFTLLHSAE